MKYQHTVCGRFIDRPNRFIAHVEVDGRIETVHVKNTGRCRELLLPDSEVILEVADNPARKTKYDLITVKKESLGWVNIDSQVPNSVVKEWLESGASVFGTPDRIRPEYTFGASRVDFYVECGERRILIEVKGCTLERERMGYFPDAPTERGVKHLRELAGAVKQGYECYIAFVIAMPEVKKVLPNEETDPKFAAALREAEAAGVKVLYLPCRVETDEITIVAE